MRRIAVINQKGGCGKTTTAINLAGVFASRSMRTLLVDMDPQSHCAAGLAIPEQRIDLDIGDAMLHGSPGKLDPTRLLWRITRNLDLAPSRMKLAGIEASRGGLSDLPDKHAKLGRLLDSVLGGYDVCCIDCPPSIGLLTFNALAAATEILIPVETSYFSLQGAAKQVATIRSLGKRLGARADYWLVPTIHDDSSALAKDLLEELRRRFGERLAPVVIRSDLALKEAASFGQPVIEYNASSRGCEDYVALAEWLLARNAPKAEPAPTQAPPSEPSPTITINSTSQVEHALGARLATPPTQGDRPSSAPAAPAVASMGGGSCLVASAVAVAGAEREKRPSLDASRQSLMVANRLNSRSHPVTAPAKPDVAETDETPSSPPTPYGVTIEGNTVVFVQPLGSGTRIAVAGDFNGWSPQAHVMHRDERRRVFQIRIPLAPGRRHYRLVVDGRWSHDPHNKTSELSPFGEQISVVDVAPSLPTIEVLSRSLVPQPAD